MSKEIKMTKTPIKMDYSKYIYYVKDGHIMAKPRKGAKKK